MKKREPPTPDNKKPRVSPLRDALLGITAINQDLAVFDHEDILIRKDYKDIKGVRILSGGDVGVDCHHATLVGKGLLTAAVLAHDESPSTRLILRAIQELNIGENSGILIVKQTNSEIFNFGLASKIASGDLGIKVKLLSLDDDNRIVHSKRSGGVILLIKILGAMAEAGKTFEEIVEFYNTHKAIGTITLQPNESTECNRKTYNYCLNINNKSLSSLNLIASSQIAVLVNICKCTSALEEFYLIKELIETLKSLGENIVRIYVGNFFWTSVENSSVSIMSITDEEVLKYLDAPCSASGWLQLRQHLPAITIPFEITTIASDIDQREIAILGPKFSEFQVKILRTATDFACDALISCEKLLNLIDSERSEGNVGTRLKDACEEIRKELTFTWDYPKPFFKKISYLLDTTIGGPMGAIYGLLFDNMAQVFRNVPENDEITPDHWIKAFGTAMEAIKKYCSGESENVTMFLPLETFEVVTRESWAESDDFVECFGAAVAAAEQAAQKTRLSDQVYSDSGAHAVGIWMRAVYEAVKIMVLSQNESAVETADEPSLIGSRDSEVL